MLIPLILKPKDNAIYFKTNSITQFYNPSFEKQAGEQFNNY